MVSPELNDDGFGFSDAANQKKKLTKKRKGKQHLFFLAEAKFRDRVLPGKNVDVSFYERGPRRINKNQLLPFHTDGLFDCYHFNAVTALLDLKTLKTEWF